MKDYSDIIHHTRPISQTHPPMSRDARAAQFTPYATLSGQQDIVKHDEAIAETWDNINQEISIEYDEIYD